MNQNILTVKNLTVTYENKPTPAVDDLSFELRRGEALGLFGRSGCGKSTVAWTVMGIIERLGGRTEGQVFFDDNSLLEMPAKDWREVRWKQIAIVPQSSMSSLNPVFKIRRTLMETMKFHKPDIDDSDAENNCKELIDMVFLESKVLDSYPHELSGGMKQRVSIALAVMLDPPLLLLDEATTGLDVVVEADILYALRRIRRDKGMSMLMISHDARIHDAFCDRRIYMQ